jgi:hypothetical protein
LTLILVALAAFVVVPFFMLLGRIGRDDSKTVEAPVNSESKPEVEPAAPPPREPETERRKATAESTDANARTYTPKKLKAMVAAGKYPEQGSPTTESKEMEFSACVSRMDEVADAIGGSYPRQVIVSTAILRIQKIWTNDAAVTVTCSAPDQKLVMTSAKYL